MSTKAEGYRRLKECADKEAQLMEAVQANRNEILKIITEYGISLRNASEHVGVNASSLSRWANHPPKLGRRG